MNEEVLNVGRDHWVVCHVHRVMWNVGSNLLSGWREEPASLHAENDALLASYREVVPC